MWRPQRNEGGENHPYCHLMGKKYEFVKDRHTPTEEKIKKPILCQFLITFIEGKKQSFKFLSRRKAEETILSLL